MKTIRLVFNKDLDDVSMLMIEETIMQLKNKFNVIDDDNSYDTLRYIDIDGMDLEICSCPFLSIQNVIKPHLHVGIYNKYLYKVEIVL